MKKILVPTDFSPNADNALTFAVHIANRTGSDVQLLHTFEISKSALVFKDVAGIMRREAEENLEKILAQFRPELEAPETLNGQVLRGGPVTLTTRCEEQKNCGLIVMGTRGATDALEVFIGSTTSAVLRHSDKPVLAIPAGFNYRPFRKIVLALDNLPLPAERVFQPLRELAAAFGASISVFHLRAKAGKGVDYNIEQYLPGIELSIHEEKKDGSEVYESINQFAQSENADLLCMVRRKKGFLQGLFQGSATRKQVYNSPVPLLVLMEEAVA